MENLGDKKSWWDRLREKKRIVLMDLKTFSESWSFQLSVLNIITVTTSIVLILITGTYFFIAYTPIKKMIPGYPDGSLQEKALYNLEQLEKTEQIFGKNNMQFQAIKTILEGGIPGDTSAYTVDTLNIVEDSLVVIKSKEDSILRAQMEKEQLSYFIDNSPYAYQSSIMGQLFYFTPLNGIVKDSFNLENNASIRIISEAHKDVKSILEGTVIFASWTADAGHVIHVQHTYDIISIYKNNTVMLKKPGEKVKAGEPIALAGKAGKEPQVYFIDFELWQNGKPLDPTLYISF